MLIESILPPTSQESLVDLVGMLKATGADMDGLKEFKSILGGKADEK